MYTSIFLINNIYQLTVEKKNSNVVSCVFGNFQNVNSCKLRCSISINEIINRLRNSKIISRYLTLDKYLQVIPKFVLNNYICLSIFKNIFII